MLTVTVIFYSLKEFWATTNVGGLTNAGNAQRNFRKAIWIFLVVIFTVVYVISVNFLVNHSQDLCRTIFNIRNLWANRYAFSTNLHIRNQRVVLRDLYSLDARASLVPVSQHDSTQLNIKNYIVNETFGLFFYRHSLFIDGVDKNNV